MNYSRQRESIINNLKGRYDHPTAENIYSSVKEEYPNISLGTVYRNLTLLADKGDILRLSVPEGPERFDYKTSPHMHFVCNKCKAITDVEMDINDMIEPDFYEQVPGVVESTSVMLYGTCPECLAATGQN